MTPLVLLTTVGADFDARTLARAIVERHLAACVNIVPAVHSVYRWEGRVHEDGEQLLVIKSVEERLPALREAILGMHPYEVPELVVVSVDALPGPYREWLIDSVR